MKIKTKIIQIIIPILLSTLLLVTFSVAEGYILPMTNLEKYLEHDLIFLGKITSLKENSNKNQTPTTNYQVETLQLIKGKLDSEKIEIVGLGAKSSDRHLEDETIFSIGDEAIFMVNKKVDGTLLISPYTTMSKNQNPDLEFILPPLKLFKAGISFEEIHCKSYLKIGLRTSNNQPACLKPESFLKLIERGWIK